MKLPLALIILLLACITIPFAYDITLSEPDLVRIMAALVYGNALGENEGAGMHYGISFSFGYYKLLYAIAPLDWLRNPDLTARFINNFGIVSGLCCVTAFALYLQNVFSRNVATVAVILFFLSPMMLPVILSGHPLVPASTFLFFGGWLLSQGDTENRRWVFLSFRIGAFIVLTIGLTFRADIIFAFPFLWLASTFKLRDFRASPLWKVYGTKAIVLAGAFSTFLILQQDYVDSKGSVLNVASFMQAYHSLSHIPKGFGVLVLGVGWISIIVTFISLIKLRFKSNEFFLVSVLALPALAFWLLNPQPARHFFFAVLACVIAIALWLERWEGRGGRKLATVACLVLLNQIAAEAARVPIVSSYEWKYPLFTDRRSTQLLPLGAFPLDQISNQKLSSLQRNEALMLERHAPDRLVILADAAHYMIAHLIAANSESKWTRGQSDGIPFNLLKSPAKEIVIVWKNWGWPKDVTAKVLQQKQWQDWPVYVQPFTVTKFDQTKVPATRAFLLPKAVEELDRNPVQRMLTE